LIIHELSQIEPQDFVYVLREGMSLSRDLEEVMHQEFDADGRGG
jgi:hypothetical protein